MNFVKLFSLFLRNRLCLSPLLPHYFLPIIRPFCFLKIFSAIMIHHALRYHRSFFLGKFGEGSERRPRPRDRFPRGWYYNPLSPNGINRRKISYNLSCTIFPNGIIAKNGLAALYSLYYSCDPLGLCIALISLSLFHVIITLCGPMKFIFIFRRE